VALDVERKRHVVAQQLEPRMAEQVRDVAARAGVEVVDAQHLAALRDEPRAQVRADEARAAGDEHPVAVERAHGCTLALRAVPPSGTECSLRSGRAEALMPGSPRRRPPSSSGWKG